MIPPFPTQQTRQKFTIDNLKTPATRQNWFTTGYGSSFDVYYSTIWPVSLHQCKYYTNSLVPQLVPLNPATQVQLYESIPSVQVPPFVHGFGAQSLMSKA